MIIQDVVYYWIGTYIAVVLLLLLTTFLYTRITGNKLKDPGFWIVMWPTVPLGVLVFSPFLFILLIGMITDKLSKVINK